MEAPTGVKILAVLSALGGILSLLGSLWGAMIVSSYPSVGEVVLGGMLAFAVGIIVGLIELAIAWGLWTGKSWAWWITVIFSGLSVLSILVLNVIGAIVGAIVLWYMFKPHVKEYFGVKVEFST